ncbi:DUF6482 family protein [Pseudomonas sp. dw_358]|uniref:DUF6482 family protein n=1 Tax=Pseudomonas sp. dw_358 TaxID=2720083 RepID=UPI001BD3E76A|nr:DUF6482 family protein [Pseudomonas sp. dw_358]
MKLDELSKQVASGQVTELDLVSVEGGSYVLHAITEGRSHPVLDAHAEPLHLASVEQARKLLIDVPELPFFLIQPAVYDEMVGHAPSENTATREPLQLRSSL